MSYNFIINGGMKMKKQWVAFFKGSTPIADKCNQQGERTG